MSTAVAEQAIARRTRTEDEARARAAVIAEVARQHVLEAEGLRRLPAETIAAIRKSELAMLLVPERWGGWGLDWAVALECVAIVGQACGSTAWCLSFAIDHNWVLCLYPEAVQREVFGRTPQPIIFTASAPQGDVVRASGGYRLNGKWSWASGVNHCDWGLIGAVLKEDGREPLFLNLLVNRDDIAIEDTWRHFGLKATGSCDVVLEDVFVPEERAVPWQELWAGRGPGQAINPGPLYRLPLYAAYPLGIMCPALGVARGALRDLTDYLKTKRDLWFGGKVSEALPLQSKLGEADALVATAEVVLRQAAKKLGEDRVFSENDLIVLRRDYMMSMGMLLGSVDMLMNIAGARGGAESNSIQRHFRDIHAMRQHRLFDFDAGYAANGQRLLALSEQPSA